MKAAATREAIHIIGSGQRLQRERVSVCNAGDGVRLQGGEAIAALQVHVTDDAPDQLTRDKAHRDGFQFVPRVPGIPRAQYALGKLDQACVSDCSVQALNSQMQGIFGSDGYFTHLWITDNLIDIRPVGFPKKQPNHEITINGFVSGYIANNRRPDGTLCSVKLLPARVGGKPASTGRNVWIVGFKNQGDYYQPLSDISPLDEGVGHVTDQRRFVDPVKVARGDIFLTEFDKAAFDQAVLRLPVIRDADAHATRLQELALEYGMDATKETTIKQGGNDMPLITVDLLRRLGVAPDVAMAWAEPLQKTALAYGLNIPTVAEDWLAQLVHESECFTKLREDLYYTTPRRLVAVWPSRFSMSAASSKRYAPEYVRNPEKLANAVYSNRMGNGDEASGDGFRFSGGGLGMLTGREMWQAYADFSGNDVINNPALFEDKFIAADSAGWMFAVAKGLVDEATDDLVRLITRRINGGYIGLKEREALTQRARDYFLEQGHALNEPVVEPVVQPPVQQQPVQKARESVDLVSSTMARNPVAPKIGRWGLLGGMVVRFVVPMIGGWIRHALTTLGGFAVAKGVVDADTANSLVGLAMTFIGFVWSSYEKKKA